MTLVVKCYLETSRAKRSLVKMIRKCVVLLLLTNENDQSLQLDVTCITTLNFMMTEPYRNIERVAVR